MRNITSGERASIGFDAGDQIRSDTVSYGATESVLNSVNVYRLDGNDMIILST